ncbi:MAG TPA: hypothetical protein VNV82_05320 [Bryobacteraceae bacterium]|jgi:hypothetical protein|nr:hypothetical protein [Bryobacteraceae bacterium]
MKLFCGLVLGAAMLAFAAVNPQLKQVNMVYILAMAGGMDQFLANQITASGVFQVVTDPKKADAIITDRLGESFETKLSELYPPPAPPAPPPPPVDEDKSKADGKKNTLDLGAGAQRVNSGARGKGNLFIVDRKSRNVLWSVFEPPKDSTPAELSKTAEKVVKRLKMDLSDKKQPSE